MQIPQQFVKLFVPTLLELFFGAMLNNAISQSALPAVIGNVGLWLAVPVSELLTLGVILAYYLTYPLHR